MSTITAALDDLIALVEDGHMGFAAAAQDVSSPKLARVFQMFAAQREQFVAQLQNLARKYGESDPVDSSSTAGTIHRDWMDIKAALIKGDPHGILVECERGEDHAVSAYRAALEVPGLPIDVSCVLEEQFTAVTAAHDQVKSLRDSFADAK